jgi:hypothetical protein
MIDEQDYFEEISECSEKDLIGCRLLTIIGEDVPEGLDAFYNTVGEIRGFKLCDSITFLKGFKFYLWNIKKKKYIYVNDVFDSQDLITEDDLVGLVSKISIKLSESEIESLKQWMRDLEKADLRSKNYFYDMDTSLGISNTAYTLLSGTSTCTYKPSNIVMKMNYASTSI